MKCLICGQLSLPGAKLCLDCKAARKRAFEATVTQPLLATGAAGAVRSSARAQRLLKSSQPLKESARRAAKAALAQPPLAAATETAPPISRRRVPWPAIIAAGCVAIAVIGYFGHWFGGKSDTMAAVPESVNVAAPADAPPSGASMPATVAAPSTVAPPAGISTDVPEPEPAPAPRSEVNKRARARVDKPPVALPTAEPAPPPEVVVVAPPPPPVIREAPRVDPFQAMYDAIARCPRDSRSACEQRLRSQYCEGHWGQVAQCASIPYVDHGS
jgi:hypothetical protein